MKKFESTTRIVNFFGDGILSKSIIVLAIKGKSLFDSDNNIYTKFLSTSFATLGLNFTD